MCKYNKNCAGSCSKCSKVRVKQITKQVEFNADLIRGIRGYSAYEIAVQQGFEGTEREWLDSLEAENILLNFRVTDDMELIMSNSSPDIVDFELTDNGELVVNI